jgi:hypothetical protein
MSRASEKTARELERFAVRERKRTARKRIAELRAALVRARAERKERIRAARDACRDARAQLKVRAKQLRAELQAAIVHERHAGRHQCQATRDATREQTIRKVVAARAHVLGARDALRLLGSMAPKTRAAAGPHVSKAETDAEVLRNIPRELAIVYQAVKGQLRTGPRISKTEAFLEWVDENGARVYELQHASHAAWLRDMEREEREHGRGRLATHAPLEHTGSDEWGG